MVGPAQEGLGDSGSLSVGDTVIIRSKLWDPGSQPRLHPMPVTSGPAETSISIQRVEAAGEAWPGGG